MSFQTSIQVRGYHCDAYGHVNNSRYLELLEEARWRALDEANVLEKIKEKGCLLFVVNIDIAFKRPVEIGNISITTKLVEVSRKVLTFEQEIFNSQNDLCTKAQIKFVLFNGVEQRAISIDAEMEEWFKSF